MTPHELHNLGLGMFWGSLLFAWLASGENTINGMIRVALVAPGLTGFVVAWVYS